MYQGSSSYAKADKERHSNRVPKPPSSSSSKQQLQQHQPYPPNTNFGECDIAYDQRNLAVKRIPPGNMPPVIGMPYTSRYTVGDSIATDRSQQGLITTTGDFYQKKRALHQQISFNAQTYRQKSNHQPQGVIPSTFPPSVVYGAGLCRTEELEVVLEATPDRKKTTGSLSTYNQLPFGFTLQPPPESQGRTDEPLTNFPLIKNVIPDGPAFQSGVIQTGDSLLAIQGDSPLGKSVDKITTRYLMAEGQRSSNRITLITQYTVADNVIPSCGVFDVRIIKRSASLGINLQASMKSRPGEPLLISKVVPGSVASRCGSIGPGDVLLAVNGISLEACSINDAVQLLQNSDDIVTLRVKKPDVAFKPLNPQFNPGSNHHGQHVSIGNSRNEVDEENEKCSDDSDNVSLSECEFSADEFENLQPFQRPRQYRSQRPKQTPPSQSVPRSSSKTRHYRKKKQHHAQKSLSYKTRTLPLPLRPCTTEESESSDPRMNLSETISSDHFSERIGSDQIMEVHRVHLTRPSVSCPWGIVISGTDDVNDAPVIIDSLTPGKPGSLCGLLRPGDQILSINDVSVTKGLTLSQVMSKLQHPSEQVIFYIARPSSTKQSYTTSSSVGADLNQSFEDGVEGLMVPASSQLFRPSSRTPQPPTARLRHQNSLKSTNSRCPNTSSTALTALSIKDSQSNFFDEYQRRGPTSQAPRPTCNNFSSSTDLLNKPSSTSYTNDPSMVESGEKWNRHQTHHHRKTNQQHHRRKDHRMDRRGGEASYMDKKEEKEEETEDCDKEATLKIDDIQCPGCREAVVNEVLLQKRLFISEQKWSDERNQRSRRRNYIKLRGRSLEFEHDSDDFEAVLRGATEVTDVGEQDSSLQVPTTRLLTKGLHYRNQAGVKGDGIERNSWYANISSVGAGVPHSRSDSRLNREINEEEDNDDDFDDDNDVDASDESTDTRSLSLATGIEENSFKTPNVSHAFLRNTNRNLEPLNDSRRRLASHRSQETLVVRPPPATSSRTNTPATFHRRAPAIEVPSQSRRRRSASGNKEAERVWKGWIRLVKPSPSDSFGIGLSEGLSSRGIYVSAIRPNSIADGSGLLHLYDRIIKVNDTSTKNRTCREVVTMIRRSNHVLDLFVHRKP